MKFLAFISATFICASAQTPMTAVATTTQPVRAVPAIEAQVVHEPLQQRSMAYQRMCRARLLAKLNRVLETRDTPRGLVVTVPDSLLADGNTVPPETSKKLAEIAEMFPPDVTIRVEGYTDHRGTSAQNLEASYKRAQAVQDVLAANDALPRRIPTAGFVSNATIAGRANRRVEIVISGQGIGQTVLSARTWALASVPGI
ncbi:MAG: OmpA family protein [Acidobacteriota bacterium]|nr:OmpA family protein [Acidobacteriota bacterium]